MDTFVRRLPSEGAPETKRRAKSDQCFDFQAMVSEREELEEENRNLSCDYDGLKARLHVLENELATAAEQHEKQVKIAVAAAFRQAYEEASNHHKEADISNVKELVNEFIQLEEADMQFRERFTTMQESLKSSELETVAVQEELEALQKKCHDLETEVQQLTDDLDAAVRAGLSLHDELGEAHELLATKSKGWTPRRASHASHAKARGSRDSLHFPRLVSPSVTSASNESDDAVSQGTRFSGELESFEVLRALSVRSAATRVEEAHAEVSAPLRSVSVLDSVLPALDMPADHIRRAGATQSGASVDDILRTPIKKHDDIELAAGEHVSDPFCIARSGIAIPSAEAAAADLSLSSEVTAYALELPVTSAPLQGGGSASAFDSFLHFMGFGHAGEPERAVEQAEEVLPDTPRSEADFAQGVDESKKEELRKWLEELEAEARDLRLAQASALQ